MSTEPLYLTADWLDGPALVRWLRRHGLENVKAFGEATVGCITRWQAGARASVYSVDRIITELDIHLSEIPEELWIVGPRTGQKLVGAQIEEIVKRVESESVRSLAREYKVSPSTIRYYRDKARSETFA